MNKWEADDGYPLYEFKKINTENQLTQKLLKMRLNDRKEEF